MEHVFSCPGGWSGICSCPGLCLSAAWEVAGTVAWCALGLFPIEYGQGSHPKLLVVYRQTCGVLTMYLWLYLSGNSAPVVT